MNQELRKNREVFADLIYATGSFTEREIIKRFEKQQHGDIFLDGGQSLTSFLKELRDNGVLNYSHGVYTVTNTQKQ
jgi:hypothetical protein